MVQVNRWYPHFRTREKQDAGWMALITTAPRVENGTDPAPASPGERTVAAIASSKVKFGSQPRSALILSLVSA
jgi:hypothetical protein